MSKLETIDTRDFYLSCFLLSKGCKLLQCRRDRGISTFRFEGENITNLSEQYYNLSSLVEPNSYGQNMKTLKSIIHRADTNTGKFNNVNKFQP